MQNKNVAKEFSPHTFMIVPSIVDNRNKCKECDVKYLCGGPCHALENFNCDRLRESILDQTKTVYNILSVSAE